MSGLGGLNRSPGRMVLGLVQAGVPIVTEPADVAAAVDRIAGTVIGSRRALPVPDLLVFPEYSLHVCNLAYTASVSLAGPDGGIHSKGAAMVCDVDGTVLEQGDGTPRRIVTAEVVPSRADEVRRGWGVENNIYQLGHRGYSAVEGGATDCPYTYMREIVAESYRLPWEDEVRHTDGTGAGLDTPADVRAAARQAGPPSASDLCW